MIELCVHDVAVRAPKDEPAEWPVSGKDYNKLGYFRVILLKEVSGDRVLPIWVGPIEGDLIAMRLDHIESPRPMTFDLTINLLRAGKVQIEKSGSCRFCTGSPIASPSQSKPQDVWNRRFNFVSQGRQHQAPAHKRERGCVA